MLEEIKKSQEDLQNAFMPLAQKFYSQEEPQTTTESSAPSEESDNEPKPAKGKVVEAEVVDEEK